MTPAMVESPFWPSDEQVAARFKKHTKHLCDATEKEVDAAERDARKQLIRENLQYARLLCLHVSELGYAPLASHLLYPQFLPETKEGRGTGLEEVDS